MSESEREFLSGAAGASRSPWLDQQRFSFDRRVSGRNQTPSHTEESIEVIDEVCAPEVPIWHGELIETVSDAYVREVELRGEKIRSDVGAETDGLAVAKVAALKGRALDWAVLAAIRTDEQLTRLAYKSGVPMEWSSSFRPTEDPQIVGLMVKSHPARVTRVVADDAVCYRCKTAGGVEFEADDPLTVKLRCIVYQVLGPLVWMLDSVMAQANANAAIDEEGIAARREKCIQFMSASMD